MRDFASTEAQITVDLRLRDARLAALLRTDLADHGFGFGVARPNVLVTDDPMRVVAGEPALVLVSREAAAVSVPLLTALASGAGIVIRDEPPELLRSAIAAAAAGQVVLPPSYAAALVEPLRQRRVRENAAAEAAHLTAREREVLELMAEGAANKAIARRLGITVHTVKFHVAAILDKLDATGRTDAVAQGARLGLVML